MYGYHTYAQELKDRGNAVLFGCLVILLATTIVSISQYVVPGGSSKGAGVRIGLTCLYMLLQVVVAGVGIGAAIAKRYSLAQWYYRGLIVSTFATLALAVAAFIAFITNKTEWWEKICKGASSSKSPGLCSKDNFPTGVLVLLIVATVLTMCTCGSCIWIGVRYKAAFPEQQAEIYLAATRGETSENSPVHSALDTPSYSGYGTSGRGQIY